MGKYDPWTEFFSQIEGDEVVLTLEELEVALGAKLPPSARRYSEWWASAHYYAKWVGQGFIASPRLDEGRVIFRRGTVKRGRPHRMVTGSEAEPATAGGDRLILLGCVAQKRPAPGPARDLYVSPLWEKRKAYAEATEQPWAILSAEHGLVMPDEVIEPYDRSLKDEPIPTREQWTDRTTDAVIALCRRLGVDAVEVHAGSG